MARTNDIGNPGALKDVAEQFRAWRDGRRRGEKIPQALWQAAVALSDKYSPETIAAALTLDFGRLQNRVAASAVGKRASDPSSSTILPEFVEVGTLGARHADECRIEAMDRSGTRVSIHLKGGGCAQASEVATRIATVLWGAGR
jgi:hypothetical protein